VHTTLGTPPEKKEQRERTTITSVASINNMDKECAKLCEESTQIWTKLMEDSTMKAIEERLRNAREKAQKAMDNINALLPSERITTILVNRQSYNET
jgi:hypothetical protein